MTKYLIRVECDTIRVFKVKKGPRQMVSVGSRLYRMDDDLMVRDTKTSDCAAIYDVDSTQPYLARARFVDPDFTRALIQSAQLSGNKKGNWVNISTSKMWEYLTAVIVVGCLIYGLLVGGGY